MPEDVARCPMHRKVVHGICRWHGVQSTTQLRGGAHSATDDVVPPPQIVVRKPEGRLLLLPPSPIGLSAAITAC